MTKRQDALDYHSNGRPGKIAVIPPNRSNLRQNCTRNGLSAVALSISEPSLALAPFRERSFRFQWPADLLTAWAFEMENLILSWYVLVTTNSVVMLTVFASLGFLGTLIAPLLGMAGDRFSLRVVMCCLRATYALLALVLMTLGLTGSLS